MIKWRIGWRSSIKWANSSDARAWVVHRNSDPVVIAPTLKVDGASKHKFKCETRDKEGIESLRERERHTKRFKALDNWDIIKQKRIHTCLDGIVIIAEGSTTRDKGGGGHGGSKVMGSSAPLFNDTKWDVGMSQVSSSKELSSCVDGTGCHSFGD